ncbi:hypothetical protein Ttaiw_02302 [Tepidimonas taiwanensis]|uniref:Uncharacterized protein n=1 Tax=Tepidimonas taiwanensis TaxID=307486 RepID=A0A554X0L8_9BURK|nr:hypothetical protein Ttaiw_02302 [Tepidimonas taiwanensis]
MPIWQRAPYVSWPLGVRDSRVRTDIVIPTMPASKRQHTDRLRIGVG